MKVRESRSTCALIETWNGAIADEYGSGWHTATLDRLTPTVRQLLESPSTTSSCLVEFGYQIGHGGHDLDFAVRCIELLAESAADRVGERLNTRHVAVLLAEGWNAGALGRTRRDDEAITPMPLFQQLLAQRYAGAELHDERISRRIALVLVDLRDVVADGDELDRLRAAAVASVREVWSVGHPITEGDNGSLAVLVDRDRELHATVGKLRRLLLTEWSLHANRIHIWIEPLSDAPYHLADHLESLLGRLVSPIVRRERVPVALPTGSGSLARLGRD